MKLYKLPILLVVLMCGCHGSSFVRDPVTGQFRIKDTSFERRELVAEVNRWVEDERTGRRSPIVDETWNTWWVGLIRAKKIYIVGNTDFYVSYIIEARRKDGLPELKFSKN